MEMLLENAQVIFSVVGQIELYEMIWFQSCNFVVGKWSGLFLESPQRRNAYSLGEDEIENVVEMEDPIWDLVNASHNRGVRNQVFILKMTYQLKVSETAVEKKIPVEKTTTAPPPQTIIVQKTSPCLDHLIKKRNSDVAILCGVRELSAHKLVLSCKLHDWF